MLFNSVEFFIFLPIVFSFYWLLNRWLTIQNLFLVAASFLFYGWWDWRFLLLLLTSAGIDYLVAIRLDKTENLFRRKFFLGLSLLGNLGILGFFKYFNFFTQSFQDAFTFFGGHIQPVSLSIVLPVGVSFYTFQALSYTIDVYRRRIKSVNNPITYFAFVSFFPQLVAGPIERASHMLPQYLRARNFEYTVATDGMRRILWGLIKKVVIADNCAVFVNEVFNNTSGESGSTLMLGAVLFAFQIYGDFSGYSDIAIGTAQLFGFELMQNFSFPYFSRDISEFWRRWHISLTSWFRDYVYIPLGGSRAGKGKQIRNTFIVFLVSGLWHGANWTFIFWGLLHAIYFLPLLLLNRNRQYLNVAAGGRVFPSFKELSGIIITFFITTLAWIFFRANSIHSAFGYLAGIFHRSIFSFPSLPQNKSVLLLLPLVILTEWFQRNKKHALEINTQKISWFARWIIYYLLVAVLFRYAAVQQPFIYFQF